MDRIENVRRDTLPFHRDMVRYLSELNSLDEDEAAQALAAFLRLRLEVGEEQQREAAELTAHTAAGFTELVELLRRFLEEDPEDGRRGQALVAAAFDLGHSEVTLASINDPTGLDVAVRKDRRTIIGVEVKQKPATESTADHLAEEAAARRVEKALLVLLSPQQRPLDRESVRRRALERHGVLVMVYESVWELVSELALHSDLTATEFANQLPRAYLRRMQQHGVSPEGQRFWIDLLRSL